MSDPNAHLPEDPGAYLAPTEYLDCRHPRVQRFVAERGGAASDVRERALSLYQAVRDDIRYDPYAIRLDPVTYRASYVLEQDRGYCVQKGALYAAACRAAGIPARPGYADVRNHLATPRLLELMQSDLFIYHGYVEIWLEDRWVKATPVFNRTLCEKFHIHPLEFDGRHDSLFHAFDARGQRHMEYVRDRGPRADVPVAEITAAMLEHYPRYFRELTGEGDFEAEAAREGHTAGG